MYVGANLYQKLFHIVLYFTQTPQRNTNITKIKWYVSEN